MNTQWNVIFRLAYTAMILGASLTLLAIEPIIYADFDGSPKSGRYTINGAVRYTNGVRGQAIVLADATVQFTVPKELTPDEGSMSVWVKPINWEWRGKEYIFFLSSYDLEHGAAKGSINLYRYVEPSLGILFFISRGDSNIHGVTKTYANKSVEKFASNEWHHLAGTWSKKTKLVNLFLDGELVSSSKLNEAMLPEKIGDIVVNRKPPTPHNRSNETAFDMIAVYHTALTENEIARLYKAVKSDVPGKLDQSNTKPTCFNLPKTHTPPKIDGSFSHKEWAGAARLSGFTRMGVAAVDLDRPSDVYAFCDDKKLYFCFTTCPPYPDRIVNRFKNRDEAVFTDDAVEIVRLQKVRDSLGHLLSYDFEFDYRFKLNGHQLACLV